jgi:hypothetical protein
MDIDDKLPITIKLAKLRVQYTRINKHQGRRRIERNEGRSLVHSSNGLKGF